MIEVAAWLGLNVLYAGAFIYSGWKPWMLAQQAAAVIA